MVEKIDKTKAFIFPGQGAQYVGMGKDIYQDFRKSKKIFDKADEILGYSLSRICFEGPLDKLSSTEISQPAILTLSIAMLYALVEGGFNLEPNFLAGLSLGEYSALVASEAIDFEEALKLVAKRGKFMQEASVENPGKMACVLGLSSEDIKDLAHLSQTEIANLNCPGQIVLSGKIENIEKLEELALEKGAKRVIILNVSGPFHSSLMTNASLKLKDELKKIDIKMPKANVVFNVTGDIEKDPQKIKENLAQQVNHATYWQKSIELMCREGVTTFIEVGCGQVLKGLLRKINPELKVYSIGQVNDINEKGKELLS